MVFKSFRFFTESSKSRQLWRYIVRLAHKAPSQDQAGLLAWAKSEFKANENVSDPDQIRYLVSEGLKRAREMDKMLELTRTS